MLNPWWMCSEFDVESKFIIVLEHKTKTGAPGISLTKYFLVQIITSGQFVSSVKLKIDINFEWLVCVTHLLDSLCSCCQWFVQKIWVPVPQSDWNSVYRLLILGHSNLKSLWITWYVAMRDFKSKKVRPRGCPKQWQSKSLFVILILESDHDLQRNGFNRGTDNS